ncbi:MAG TPA: DUF444 family protein [Myxococcota bacterium]|nr:DUF444 family protein [Myxococcota bacterium]
MLRIDQDLGRFKDIVKGRVRRELRRYMSSGELIGKQGDKLVSIPIPRIGIPRLRYGDNDKGVGQGEDGGPGQQAGEEGGEHAIEVDVTMEELADLLGQELQLPNIEPKGTKTARSARNRYKGVARTGPESLRHTRRTYRAAMRRTIASGGWDPRRPVIVPHKDDKRYRTFRVEQEPRSAALILYMMDVSGSMGQEQKDIVRSEAFWIDLWIRRFYQDVETRFIIHDATAREVDRDTFFRTRESGGTLISSAYKLAVDIIEREYPVDDWNIYPFHFSDGDNWSQSDTRLCMQLLKDKLIPWSNQFSYAQVDSQYGSGQFLKDLAAAFPSDPKLVVSRVPNRDGILDSIRQLMGRGN